MNDHHLIPDFLQGGGAMGERIRSYDWASHPLGAPALWPDALRMAISLCLNSSFPTAVYWGPQFHVLYNDAWAEIPADKHPWILGKPAREGWSDIWHLVGPQFERVFATGEGEASYERMLPMLRGGRPTETWWNYSLTAIRQPDHSVGGIFNQGNDITAVVVGRREREAELARWRDLFRQAPAGVALMRGKDHVFEYVNDAYVRLVGGRDVIGKRVSDALPEVAGQGFIHLLDGVYATGQPHIGHGVNVKLQRAAGGFEDCTVDFIYQPLRAPDGRIDGIFVLVTDVTERARAEAALRLSNWQLGEERARLASAMEAEQRAQQALRRFTGTLEGQVKQRTEELTRALELQHAVSRRLRATFETALIFQGYMDADGTLLDANPASLAAIGAQAADVTGRPFWDTPWFTATPGMPERIRAFVEDARGTRRPVQADIDIVLAGESRRFRFSVRPVLGEGRRVIGFVPEALDLSRAAA